MVCRNSLHEQPLALADSSKCPFHLRLVREHGLPIAGTDVVEVNVHRQPRHIEQEEIECRSALERKPRAQEGVRVQRIQEAQEAKDLLERVGAKAMSGSGLLNLVAVEVHATSPQERVSICSGTIRFQREMSLPPLRRRLSK
jgi:hypothetical protein